MSKIHKPKEIRDNLKLLHLTLMTNADRTDADLIEAIAEALNLYRSNLSPLGILHESVIADSGWVGSIDQFLHNQERSGYDK